MSPFKSNKQRKFMNANPDVLGKEGLKEWNKASEGKVLPEKAKKKTGKKNSKKTKK